MSKKWKIVIGIFVAIFFVVLLLPSKPPIAKAIAKDPKFNYATSITGKVDPSERANVYTVNMSVPAAAKYIIAKSKPESHTDLNSKESIQLVYDDYYVLVYKGEAAKTYVQTSSRKYVHQNGYHSMYRPFYPGLILLSNRNYTSGKYYNNDNDRYGGGFDKSANRSSSKINTDSNSSSKIKTDSSSSNKIKTSSGSVRSDSAGSRASVGGGTSFGK